MKHFGKFLLFVIVLSVVLSGCAFGGPRKIGKDAALGIALTDAGLARNQVTDVDIELERSVRSAWYEIDFESGWTEYDYKIDAYSGDILSSRTD